MRYGLIGKKLGHSFSKIIHERLCAYTYDLIELTPEEVGPFLTRREFSAINVTIPYKETVIPYLTAIDPAAKAIGAVNTVVNRDGLLYGYNTDFAGIEYLLDAHGVALRGKKVLVLGSGGTCKTASAVARSRGAREILVVSRAPGQGQISYDQTYTLHHDADVVINTTPAGMFPDLDAKPIDLARFDRLSFVVDVIYNPLRTALLLQARALAIPCCNGLEMLVAQAKRAAERFLDAPLPEGAVAAVHRELLTERSNLVLIGMPSCGKTTLGRLLASRMGRQFVDLDDLIRLKAGKSIPDIFAREGEAGFRAREKAALRSVCGGTGLILSTGGGIVKDEDNIRLLRHNGALCFVDRPLYRKFCDFAVENTGAPEDAARRMEEKFHETVCD